MIFIFYFFASLQLISSIHSISGGIRFLRFFRAELEAGPNPDQPSATIFVPCKGDEHGLRENLEAVLNQNYPEYEVVFIVESDTDPAWKIVSQASSAASVPSKTVIAGKASDSGQKIHNLLAGIECASEESGVFVFADSDARPFEGWLRSLVSGLHGEGIACATGYRWFVPSSASLFSHLRSVWNASIASALGPDVRSNFCWGGSTAILKDLFRELDVEGAWNGTLSDDFALTKRVKEAGFGVRFVPDCLIASHGDCGFRELFEFTTRQMKITRVYSPDLWLVSFAGSALFTGTLAAAVLLSVFAEGFSFWFAVSFLIAVLLSGTLKAFLRLLAVSRARGLGRGILLSQLLPQLTLWTVTPFIFLVNDISAALSRKITWRGVSYVLESPTKTRVMGRSD